MGSLYSKLLQTPVTNVKGTSTGTSTSPQRPKNKVKKRPREEDSKDAQEQNASQSKRRCLEDKSNGENSENASPAPEAQSSSSQLVGDNDKDGRLLIDQLQLQLNPVPTTAEAEPLSRSYDSGILADISVTSNSGNDESICVPANLYNCFNDKPKWSSRDFKRVKQIGKGGFSAVYEASVKGYADVTVALKVVNSSILKKLNNNKENCAFIEEFELHQSLKHLNIVQMLTSYRQSRCCVMVMEYCRFDLQQYIVGEATKDRSLKYIKQLAEGLSYLHLEAKILHMDLKLENVLISTDRNFVKITDFGFAMKIPEGDLRAHYTRSRGGTRWYKPPEQLRRMRFDSTADIWAFGCISYELIFHRHPFFSTDNTTTSYRSENDQPNAITLMISASKGIYRDDKELAKEPADFRRFLMKVLAYRRFARATALELQSLLNWIQ